jgi:acyl carrier protein
MVEESVRRFLVEELQFDRGREMPMDFPLIENQVLDSLGIFQMVSFLESEFAIEVLDEELVPENFSTITLIARYVRSKAASGS